MRREPTIAERKLWLLLKSSRLSGLKFRRQVPMGHYIADFVCHEHKLVVEADGGQHGSETDLLRDQWFQAAGYRVLRFWNNDILNNTEGVLETILLATPQVRR
jgi:very-short-patch-repair endonuclease